MRPRPRAGPLCGRLEDAHVVRVLLLRGQLGYQVWPAALAGAAWACKNNALFEGKRVLELGSGVGLFGCAIARTEAAKSR